jgi:hypothetical protein
MQATVKPEDPSLVEISRHAVTDDGVHWIEIDISGWDDVRKTNKRTLIFEGREYGWSCWNSDRMVSVFKSPAPQRFATIKGK